jgi:hypothetical protein
VLFGGFVSYQGHSAMILKLIPIILYDVWLWSSLNDFIAPYLYYSLLRGVTLGVLPLSSYAFSHCWKHPWTSCCETAFSAVVTSFRCLQCAEIFVPLRQTLFLETATSHSEPYRRKGMGVPYQ